MALQTLETIKNWFRTGLKPTQAQFWDTWDSFRHKNEKIPVVEINGIDELLQNKTEKELFENHLTDPNAHVESFNEKLDKGGFTGTAKNIDDRLSAIENPDRVLKFGTITLTGLDVTIAANAFAWVLNKVSYLTPDSYSETIIAASTGMYRNDILVGTEAGIYEIIKGSEGATGAAAVEPSVPVGTIKLGFISVFGASVIDSGSTPSTEKPTIVDNDRFIINDSEDSFSKKGIKFLNLKNNFNSLYGKIKKSIISNTSINYTFQLTDGDNGIIVHSNSAAITEIIPNNSSVAFPIGTVIESVSTGTGMRTSAGATGVTLQTNISLTSVKNEIRRFTKIDTNTWLVAGNILPEARVKGVYFVSSLGNDSTAQYENADKAYLTLDAAITAFLANPSAIYIQILTPSSFNINVAMNNGTTRAFDLRSDVACIVNVTTTNLYTLNLQSFNINMPNGSIYFNPTIASRNGFNNAFVNIKANLIEFSATYQPGTGNSSESNLISNILNIKTTNPDGLFAGTGGQRKINIKTGTLNFRGISYLVGTFMVLTLDFDNLTHDNTFLIANASFTANTIYHGNISSVAPYVNTTNFNYIYGNNLTLNFKGVASISSNISINRFNTNGTCIITGIANFPNSDQLIGGGNNNLGLTFIEANITVKNLINAMNLTKLITFSNCTIKLLGGFFANYIESTGGITYDSITADFIGNNYIIVAVDGANITRDEPNWTSTNQPTWNIKNGILFTNGVISPGVNILRRNLNQYNSAVIMP